MTNQLELTLGPNKEIFDCGVDAVQEEITLKFYKLAQTPPD